MKAAIDVDAYLRRIGYTGKPEANLETLEKIVALHTRSIPFENLNPFLGWPVKIELPDIEKKLVHSRRGGYCYEQNALLRAVLESLGIRITPLAARVLWQAPEDATPAQSHMMLRAELGGIPYLVDAGFGVQTPTRPLRLDTEEVQVTPHGHYRILRCGEEYRVETEVLGAWKPIYRFDLQVQSAGDYKVFNWYCSTHPDSHFTTDLIATRAVEGGRYTLSNKVLSFYPADGPKRKSDVKSSGELRRVLLDTFNIELPDTGEVDRALETLFSGSHDTAA